MLEVLSISVPFYGLIFVGVWLNQINFFSTDFFYDLGKFAFYLAMPAYIMLSIASIDIKEFFHYKFILYYEINTIILFIISAIISKNIFSLSSTNSGIFGLNCSYPNYGYIGIPLSIMAFGKNAAIAIALIIFADTLVLLSLTIFFVSLNQKNKSFLKYILFLMTSLLKNPLMLGVIFGITISLSEIKMHILIDSFLNFLAGAAIPVALISIGGLIFFDKSESYKFKELGFISIIKLIIHPLLIAGTFIIFEFENIIWIQTAILAACLPVASNVFLIASSYNSYQHESAQSITITTLLSTISIPLVLFILINYL